MNSAPVVILLTAVLTLGIVTGLVGDKVRGEKGEGQVNQEMVDPNHNW